MSVFRNHLMKLIQVDRFKIVSIEDSIAGDICLYNNIDNSTIIVNGKFSRKDFPIETYTPFGVVVIPGSHKIYGENTCGVMSLAEMSCDSPSTGTIDELKTMALSPQQDLNVKNYNVVVIYDTDNVTLRTNGFGYLSKNGQYNYNSAHIPDPYNEDMSRNPDYYNTTVSPYNAMSDFKGIDNTNLILNHRGKKNYKTWAPVYNTATDYPAASCCDMFFTKGTTQGQWYLPAAGEWGYITSKWNILQKSLSLLNKNYNNIAHPLADNASYWTSSEHNAKNARYVHTDNGMDHTTKTTANRVRSFMILKPDLQFPIYLYTECLDGDFYRRQSDTLALDIINWYNRNCVNNTSGGSYIPSEILARKIYIDDYEITSLSLSSDASDYLEFETDYDYGMNPMKVIQYKNSNGVIRGTIDIM